MLLKQINMHHKCTQGWARGVIFEKLVYKNEINPKIVYLLGFWKKKWWLVIFYNWQFIHYKGTFIIKTRLL